jgi:hypothetical protein
LILAILVAAPAWGAADEAARVLQERVKAAFLYKFASYVEWPATAFPKPDSPIVIGVAGADQLSKELQEAVGGRQVAGRTLQVRQVGPETAVENCCHILFVGADSRHERTMQLLASAKERAVLTVTDSPDHPTDSVINFLVVDDRVRFDISRESAERKGLQLRSQLLGVARQIVSR